MCGCGIPPNIQEDFEYSTLSDIKKRKYDINPLTKSQNKKKRSKRRKNKSNFFDNNEDGKSNSNNSMESAILQKIDNKKHEKYNSETEDNSYPLLRKESSEIIWKRGELIGNGSKGKVYQGLNLLNGQIIAIKSILVL